MHHASKEVCFLHLLLMHFICITLLLLPYFYSDICHIGTANTCTFCKNVLRNNLQMTPIMWRLEESLWQIFRSTFIKLIQMENKNSSWFSHWPIFLQSLVFKNYTCKDKPNNKRQKASTVMLVTYQNIERSEVSTNISTKESTIFVWKMIVFIIFPSSLWSARLSEALETLV